MTTSKHSSFYSALAATLAGSLLSLFVSGCAVQGTGTSTSPAAVAIGVASGAGSTPHAISKMMGNVHGGQQPISGGTIQLYEVGATGYTSTAKPLIAGGDQVAYEGVSSLALTSGGSGYTAPVVTVSAGGITTATGTATVAGGVITGLTLTYSGSGYTSAPLVTISDSTGVGAAATAAVACTGNGCSGAYTDSNGGFNITGDYTCDSGTYVYLTASGGNPGLTAGTNNTGIALMAALGPCATLSSVPFVYVNEVTTVAGAYALAQFSGGTAWGTVGGTNFATSSTNTQGVANAMATAQVLGPYTSGSSPGNNTNGTASPDYWQVNMISDILSACVNSASASSTSCTTLFANVNPQTAAPADTLQAAVAMALSPTLTTTAGGQIANLYGLIASSGTPFQPYPDVYTQVNDMTIGISYAPSVPGTVGSAIGYITLNTVGAGCVSPTVTVSAPPSGTTATATVSGATGNTVIVTNPGSGYTAPPTFTFTGCTTAPTATAVMTGVNLLNRLTDSLSIDQYGNVWAGSQSKVNSTTGPVAGINPAVIVELDPTGNPIPTSASPTANAASYQVYNYSINGAAAIPIGGTYNGGHYYGPLETAIDTNNNVWFTDSGQNGGITGTRSSLVGVTGSGAAYTATGYNGSLYNGGATAVGYAAGSSVRPLAIAIDGSNDIWFTIGGGTYAYTDNSDNSATIANLASLTLKGTYGILAAGTPGSGSTTTGPGTSVVYSGPGSQQNYFLYIDPNKTDTAGNAIAGAPFLWGPSGGSNPTGNGGDGSDNSSDLTSSAQGSLFQYYTAAGGLDYLGATLNAGAPTPLTHNADPNGVVEYNGITSNEGGFLPTLAFTGITGCTTAPTASPVLGSGGTITSVILVNAGAGCTGPASGTVTVTNTTGNVPPTTAAALTYTVSAGSASVAITNGGAGYGTGTTQLSGTLSATGGTTGPNVTVANGATGASDRYDFLMANPDNMVFDASGNAWILNNGNDDSTSTLGDPALTVSNGAGSDGRILTKVSINYGTAFTPAQFEASTMYTVYHGVAGLNLGSQESYLAVDGSSNIYVGVKTDYGLSSTGPEAISNSGTMLSPTTNKSGVYGFSGSCYFQSTAINGPGTSCTGANNAGQASPYHRYVTFMQEMAVDLSGNLWYGAGADGDYTYVGGGGRVVEIVGLATPIVTPTALGLKNATYATKP
jgi:hypothetical protein